MFFLVGSKLAAPDSSASKHFLNKDCVIKLKDFQNTPFKEHFKLTMEEMIIPVGTSCGDADYTVLPSCIGIPFKYPRKGETLPSGKNFLSTYYIPSKKGGLIEQDCIYYKSGINPVFLPAGSTLKHTTNGQAKEYFPHDRTACLNFVKGPSYTSTWWCEKQFNVDYSTALLKGCTRSGKEGWEYANTAFTSWVPNVDEVMSHAPNLTIGSITVLVNSLSNTYRVAAYGPLRFVHPAMFDSIINDYMPNLSEIVKLGKNSNPISLEGLIEKYGLEDNNEYLDESPEPEEENSEFF